MNNNTIPIVVDLDGSLTKIDTLHEGIIRYTKSSIFNVFKILFWLIKGKCTIKHEIATRTPVDPEHIPFNKLLISWLLSEKLKGRNIILCTGSNINTANLIATHLNIFDEVHASNQSLNLTGANKRKFLDNLYGKYNYDYVGNSRADHIVWQGARNKINANILPEDILQNSDNINNIHNKVYFSRLLETLKIFRVHQWVKNSLIFVPVFTAHNFDYSSSIIPSIISFIAFCICSSAIYIFNDILDIDNDRCHKDKCNRPFSSGNIPISFGIFLSPILMLIGIYIASKVNTTFVAWTITYIVLASFYTIFVKKIIITDCILLAFLYTIRILAGASAINVPMSFWLLTFSIFIFLSLAYVKRYSEILCNQSLNINKLPGRGYKLSDLQLVSMLGISSSYISILILALYINSNNVAELYSNPKLLWFSIPITLNWISWIWSQAHRNNIHNDPIVYAITDKVSIASATLLGLTYIASSSALFSEF